MKEVKTLVVGDGEDGVRLDRWLRRRWPHLGQIQIQKLKDFKKLQKLPCDFGDRQTNDVNFVPANEVQQ
jgi:hypothetical protein